MHDLVIRGGTVVDGTGGASRSPADVAVDDGRITEVGRRRRPGAARSTPTACSSRPGWVDIHTHYDGQATWDPQLAPSSWHGVTTVVMGNCGVGFAPVHPGGEHWLIELMEGVEDIPGTALHEGIDWRWETFPEYLDALDRAAAHDRRRRAGAARGAARLRDGRARRRQRAWRRADEIAAMGDIVAAGIDAGALGILDVAHARPPRQSTATRCPAPSPPRTSCSRSRGVLRERGDGVFEVVSAAWTARSSDGRARASSSSLGRSRRDTGTRRSRSRSCRPTSSSDRWRRILDASAELRRRGRADLSRRSPAAPPGMLFGLQSKHTCSDTPPTLPRARRRCRSPSASPACASPRCARRILAERDRRPGPPCASFVLRAFGDSMFPLGDPPDYEPAPDDSRWPRIAERDGSRPAGGRARLAARRRRRKVLLFARSRSYAHGDHDAIREMIDAPDDGARARPTVAPTAALICDASMPTLHAHALGARPRRAASVCRSSRRCACRPRARAASTASHDRGTLAAGKRADLNLIDLDGLSCGSPRWCSTSLPAAAGSCSDVDGYVATIVAGEVTNPVEEPPLAPSPAA